MATMRPSRCSIAAVSIDPSFSRMTKPARPLIVAVRAVLVKRAGSLRAIPASQQREGSATLRNFSDLGLSAPILGALAAEGYAAPTPIQFQAVPPVLGGRDLCATAQTGTSRPPPSCYQPASGSAPAAAACGPASSPVEGEVS